MPNISSTTQVLTDPISKIAITPLTNQFALPLADGFDALSGWSGRSSFYPGDSLSPDQSDLLFALSGSGASAASLETAIPINPAPTGQTLSDTITPNNPDKFYRFKLANRSNIKFGLNNLNGDLNLYLLDVNGNVVSINNALQQSTNTGTLAEAINTNLNAGVYYIKLAAGAANTNISFNLNFQATANSHPDLLWRNYATGGNLLWLMNGTNVGLAPLPAVPDLNWHIESAADLNSDGSTDIVWRNQANGANLVWFMNGNTYLSMAGLAPVADLNWQIQGTGDFNQDGKVDLVWRNQVTGANLVWLLDGTALTGMVNLTPVADFNWQIQGTGDFNQDGKVDLVWRNQTTGANLIWSMNGITLTGLVNLPAVADLNWQVTAPFTQFGEPAIADLAGNTAATAFDLGTLNGVGTYRDAVNDGDPIDFYRFRLESTANVNLALTKLTANAGMRLFRDANNNGVLEASEEIKQANASGTADESINLQSLVAGNYYVQVYQFSGNTTYTLQLDSLNPTSLLPTEIDLGILSTTRVATGAVGSTNTSDVYRFDLSTLNNLNLTLTGLSSDADIRLIRDTNGNGIVDSGEDLARSQHSNSESESIALKDLPAGTYFIQIYQYSGNTNYTLTLSTTSGVGDGAGNTLGTARNIGLLSSPQTFNDFVGSSDTNDFYRFSLNQTNNFTLSLTGLGADADVQLIQDVNNNGAIDAGDVIASSANSGNSSESLTKILTSGTYFVRVYQYSGDTNYSLTVSAIPYNAPVDNAGNTLGTARNIGLLSSTQTFNDFVGDADVNDFYRFSLNQSSSLNLALTGLTADADTQLIQDKNGNGAIDSGDVIAYPYQDGTTPENLTIGLAAGTYFIRIFQYSGNTNYTLTVSATSLNLPAGYDLNYGYGLVNAAAAVAQALGQSPFPNVPNLGGNNWGLDLVNAPEVWAKGYTGQGVVVAVVDTGVDYAHPDLNDNIWVNTDEIAGNNIDDDNNGFVDDVRGWDFVGNDNTPIDVYGHGTHVAGTIAAENNGFGVTGVAYNAKIMPVKVLDDDGSGSYTNVAAGIRYAADNGANIINLSLGGGFSSIVEAAVQYATQKGSLVVMAAGNEGEAQPGFPANMATQIGLAVGAVDSNKKMADFSNRAGVTPVKYVVAPGVSVYSTTPNNTYQSFNGTSMATPHVAAVAALILSAKPNLTPAQLASLITGTANPTGITV